MTALPGGRVAPPIPATCSRLDVTPDGLVIPYVQIRAAGDRPAPQLEES